MSLIVCNMVFDFAGFYQVPNFFLPGFERSNQLQVDGYANHCETCTDLTPLKIALRNPAIPDATVKFILFQASWLNDCSSTGHDLLRYSIQTIRCTEILDILCSDGTWNLTDEKANNIVHLCARYGTPSALTYFLKQDKTDHLKNAQNCDGHSPLHAAIQRRPSPTDQTDSASLEIIRILCENNVNMKIYDNCVISVLRSVVFNITSPQSFEKFVEILAANDCLDMFNDPSEALGETFLHLSVLNLELTRKTIQLMMTHGIDLSITTKSSKSLLSYTVQGRRSADFLQTLVDLCRINSSDSQERNILHTCVLNGQITGLEIFLDLTSDNSMKGAQDADGNTRLHLAVMGQIKSYDEGNHDRVQIIKLLFDRKVWLKVHNKQNFTALHEVSRHEDGHLFEEFVSLLFAKGKMDMIKISGGKNGESPLHLATRNFEPTYNCLTFITASGVDLNALTDKNGKSVLFYAVEGRRDLPYLRYLASILDWSRSDKDGNNIIHIAASSGYEAAINYNLSLDKSDALRNVQNSFGSTPLHLSMIPQDGSSISQSSEGFKIIDLLCEKRINFRARDSSNFTAVHYAGMYLTPDAFDEF